MVLQNKLSIKKGRGANEVDGLSEAKGGMRIRSERKP
jgi:hypothetical protein